MQSAFARVLVLVPLLCGSLTSAQEDPSAPPVPAPPSTLDPIEVAPPLPKADQDFAVLQSGEVLLGEARRYWDGRLTFKSDGADATLKLPFGNIRDLRCTSPMTWLTTELEELVGPGQIEGDLVLVETEEGVRSLPRKELLRLIRGVPSESQYWSARFYVGVSATTGNTRQLTGLATADVRRETSISRLDMGYRGAYGLSDGEEAVKSHEGLLELRVFISRRFYLIPALGRVLYDKFQNIRLRATGGSGAGYFLIRDPGLEWALEGGGSYTYTEFRRTPAGESRTRNDTQARVATRVEWDITDTISFKGTYEVLIGLNDIENTIHQGEATLSIQLYEDLDLTLSVIWKRVERPIPLAAGSRPHHDDAKFSLGLTLQL